MTEKEQREYLQDYCTFDIIKSRISTSLIETLYDMLVNNKIVFKITKGEIDFKEFRRNIGKIYRIFGDTYNEKAVDQVYVNYKRLEGCAVVLKCSARNREKLILYLAQYSDLQLFVEPIYPMRKTEICLVDSYI